MTRAEATALPYASILAWFDEAPKAFMVLGEVRPGERLVWFSSNRQVIVTQGGFVVQTAGLPTDLTRTRFADDQPPDLASPPVAETTRFVDVEKLRMFDWPMGSTFRTQGRSDVVILDIAYELVRVEEQVVPKNGQPWVNSYWVDPSTGRVMKSRQQLVPGSPPLNIEVVKPFAAA